MKLSDYVIDFFSKLGTEHNFLVTGGAVLHLADSTGNHPNMEHICVQHEESGGAAADGYFRASGKIGIAMTTSGPGATNLLTSVCNAYFDSIPMICVTGQVARFRLRPNEKLRQRGFQETDVSAVYKSVTKYVQLIKDPTKIRYELEKAVYIAHEGRPGPVILDIPDDLQREEIDPNLLEGFIPPTLSQPHDLEEKIETLFKLIEEAKRPILIYGAGIHAAKREKEAIAFAKRFDIPVFLTWGATDLLPFSHPLNMGGVGVCGPRAGNFAAQTSDLVIAIGTRLSQMITGGRQDLFAPCAKKVMIDIDPEELNKFNSKTFTLDLPIQAHLSSFFKISLKSSLPQTSFIDWKKMIQTWREKYPVCSQENEKKDDNINPYIFIKKLSRTAKEGALIVTDTGANICCIMQAFETKKSQRIFSAWNHTPMGYALPASIGAALGSKKEVLCLIGDGGLMMCLQELATLSRYQLPVKVFVFDNGGHATVKQTIEIWLESRYVAVDRPSGLSFPNYKKLAEAFSLNYYNLETHRDLQENLPKIFAEKGPLFCRLAIDPEQRIVPMLKFGEGLHDLHPKLPKEEIEKIFLEAESLTREEQYV